jgi:hypothetical protein
MANGEGEKNKNNADNPRKRERTYAHVMRKIFLLILSSFETTREEEAEEEEEKCISISARKKSMNYFISY